MLQTQSPTAEGYMAWLFILMPRGSFFGSLVGKYHNLINCGAMSRETVGIHPAAGVSSCNPAGSAAPVGLGTTTACPATANQLTESSAATLVAFANALTANLNVCTVQSTYNDIT